MLKIAQEKKKNLLRFICSHYFYNYIDFEKKKFLFRKYVERIIVYAICFGVARSCMFRFVGIFFSMFNAMLNIH